MQSAFYVHLSFGARWQWAFSRVNDARLPLSIWLDCFLFFEKVMDGVMGSFLLG